MTYIGHNLCIFLDQRLSLIVPCGYPFLYCIRLVIKVGPLGKSLLQDDVIHVEDQDFGWRSNLLFKQFSLWQIERETVKDKTLCISSLCINGNLNQLNDLLLQISFCTGWSFRLTFILTSGTGIPWLMIWKSCFPLSLPPSTSFFRRSPLERWVKPYFATMLSHWVPLPDPGPPNTWLCKIDNSWKNLVLGLSKIISQFWYPSLPIIQMIGRDIFLEMCGWDQKCNWGCEY